MIKQITDWFAVSVVIQLATSTVHNLENPYQSADLNEEEEEEEGVVKANALLNCTYAKMSMDIGIVNVQLPQFLELLGKHLLISFIRTTPTSANISLSPTGRLRL